MLASSPLRGQQTGIAQIISLAAYSTSMQTEIITMGISSGDNCRGTNVFIAPIAPLEKRCLPSSWLNAIFSLENRLLVFH